MKKCFVIMGYGRRTDYESGRTLDLDKTYKNIIKPAVTDCGYECIRSDEIQESGLIDKSMYGLLLQAELVIADISTHNPNAIYELGIRHAVKPYSTIILKEDGGAIPFDLSHIRIFKYKHLGEDIGFDEAERCKRELASMINNMKRAPKPDSPFYELLNVTPPILEEDEIEKLYSELADKEDHLFAIIEVAKSAMIKGDFSNAIIYWERALKIRPQEPYYIQQLSLSTYKSEKPNKEKSLTKALSIIGQIGHLIETNDPETLGITGAIYKNLFEVTGEKGYLEQAIDFYGKGFKVRQDYYTGENYALCLNIKASTELDEDEKIYLKIEAKKTRESIVETLAELLKDDNNSQRDDTKWIFATLSNCYYALGRESESQIYYEKFYDRSPSTWEKDTFSNSRLKLKKLLSK